MTVPSLPPSAWKPVADAIGFILAPSAKRVAPGLLALVEAVMQGRSKSTEELLVESVEAQIAGYDRRATARQRLVEIAGDPNTDHQRILAREVAEFVTPERFVMPALPIAGPIFRESEFEEQGSAIWKMWVQLLARACDADRVGQAHPAFPRLIAQLSSDEAKLLEALVPLQPRTEQQDMINHVNIPTISTRDAGLQFPSNLSFYLGHLGSLGFLVLPMGWAPVADHVMIDDVMTYMLTDFGRTFMAATTKPADEAVSPKPVRPEK